MVLEIPVYCCPDKQVIPNVATQWQQRPDETRHAEAEAATIWQSLRSLRWEEEAAQVWN